MDDIVKLAMAKWPHVPHCYGWLKLDARGNWKLRDERTQEQNLPGEKIIHPALLGFIQRNYHRDERGCWYFQNGPQRVFVDLEVSPYIVRTDCLGAFIDQTGQRFSQINAAWLTETGQLVLRQDDRLGLMDDRDIVQSLTCLEMNGAAADDESLMEWLTSTSDSGELTMHYETKNYKVQYIKKSALASHFKFVCNPTPDTGAWV